MHREGYKIVSISDMYGAIANEKGLDVPAVMAHLKKTGKLQGFAGARELPCDVLVPAATENQITSKNAERIHAKLIIEGANGPTTDAADAVLEKKGVLIVPDILANAGGVT